MTAHALGIITPVYNRADELPHLYQTLCEQTCQDFVWYVVDDGSTDDSWKTIESMAASASFEIHALRKENGGKHTAVNFAIRHVEEPLTFIVDSDDWLPSYSVETILKYFRCFGGDSGICGISFLRRMNHAPQEADEFPEAPLRGTYMDIRVNRGIAGDKAEVFYTKCLKENPFPEFAGERFYHEDGLWARLSARYEMYHVNEVVYEGRYLEDGLTRDGRALKMASPLGMCDRSAQFLGYPGKVVLKQRIKHAILWDVYSAIARSHAKKLPCTCPAPMLCTVLSPIAAVLRRRWEENADG